MTTCHKWTPDTKKEIKGAATGWCLHGGFYSWGNCDGDTDRCEAEEETEKMKAIARIADTEGAKAIILHLVRGSWTDAEQLRTIADEIDEDRREDYMARAARSMVPFFNSIPDTGPMVTVEHEGNEQGEVAE